MAIIEFAGVDYRFIDFMSDEIILLRNERVFGINTAMLQLLGGEAGSYIGETYHNLINTSVDIMNLIVDCQYNSEESFSCIMRKFNGEGVFVNFNITLLDDITYMLIVKEKEEEIESKLYREFDLKQQVSEESFFWILGAAWDAIYIYDEEEKLVFANNAAAKLAGFSDYKEILGRKMMDVMTVHPDYNEEINTRRSSVLCGTTTIPSCEQKLIRRDGTVVVASISAVSYEKNGKRNVMLIARDITEKKQEIEKRIELEEALEYDRLKTEFFSNISHEFRTPLNIILGTLQLINSMHDGPERCECFDRFSRYFKMIRQNCYRL